MLIIARNHRIGHGEIDIIAMDGNCLVFCEVKTRLNYEFGEPFESVSEEKQSQLRRLAEIYIAREEAVISTYEDIRFDVISIVIGEEGAITAFEHIEDAF